MSAANLCRVGKHAKSTRDVGASGVCAATGCIIRLLGDQDKRVTMCCCTCGQHSGEAASTYTLSMGEGVVVGSDGFENTGGAHACADAHGYHAVFLLVAAQAMQQRSYANGTGGTQWVA